MYRNQSHETWGLPFMVFFILSIHISAQCPLTKSASFAMVPLGLPSLEDLQPTELFLYPDDTLNYRNLSLSKDNFLCIDVGIQEIELSGTTMAGESFICQEIVWVYDSVSLCSNTISNPKVVGGLIYTENKKVVPNIAVALSSDDLNYFRGTNDRGAFLFEDLAPQKYRLSPDLPFNNNFRNGITTFDVLLLQKHILGIRDLDSPYKLIAADLNSSSDITAYDMVILRQMILSVINEFPKTPSWYFIEAAYEFENPKAAYAEDFSTSVLIDLETEAPYLNNQFIAVKVGDLNNSAALNATARNRTSKKDASPLFNLRNKSFNKEEIFTIPIIAARDLTLAGIQLGFTYNSNKLELLEMTGLADFSFRNYSDQEGEVLVSWTQPFGLDVEKGDFPIHLTFKSIEKGQLSEVISLNQSLQENEIYTLQEEILPFSINWNQQAENSTFKTFDNYPNPFTSSTTIPFILSDESEVTFNLFDASGRVIFRNSNIYPAGNQVFELDETLPAAGVYFYKMESKFGVVTGRLNYLLQ